MGHPLTPGVPGALGVAPRSQTETSENQKILLTKVVRYVLGVTKNAFGVTPDPLGSRGGALGVAPGGPSVRPCVQRLAPIPAGESQDKSCYICLRGDKNALRVIS